MVCNNVSWLLKVSIYCHIIFLSASMVGIVDSAPVFYGATALVESGTLLHLPNGVHAFLSDIELLSVFHGCD